MQANDTKSMYAADGCTANGFIQIQSATDYASALGCDPITMDDAGLSFLIDGNRNTGISYNHEADYFISGQLSPDTNVDSNIQMNFGDSGSCKDNFANQPTSGDVDLRFMIESNIQSYPITPAYTPPHYGEFPYDLNSLEKSIGLERQTSLSVALEVLGGLPPTNPILDEHYPPTPSPPSNQDELCIQHPSPSFVYHSTPFPQSTRNRTVSDHIACSSLTPDDENSRPRTFSADNACSMFSTSFSAASCAKDADTDTGSSDKENQSDGTTADTATSSNAVDTTVATNPKEDDVPGLRSLPSFLLRPCENPLSVALPVDESLDMEGMLQDFLHDTNVTLKKREEDVKTLRKMINSDHSYCTKQTTVAVESCIATSSTEKQLKKSNHPDTSLSAVIDLTKEEASSSSSVPGMKRTPSYVKKRDQNNRACRESRRKRKVERDGAEVKLKTFAVENEEMKKKIVQLEKEIKETRSRLIARMTQQS